MTEIPENDERGSYSSTPRWISRRMRGRLAIDLDAYLRVIAAG